MRVQRLENLLIMVGVMFLGGGIGRAQESGLAICDFEGGVDDWAIPDWALASPDNVSKSLNPSPDFVSHGKGSLQVLVDFPGGKWMGAYLERTMYVTDWTPFSAIAADIYVPYNAPKGLKARFILTVGEKWEWTEMNRALDLHPDQWTTVTANLKEGSLDWKFFPDETFRKDIRKIGIRIESDKEPVYSGPIYIDNIRLIKG